MARWAADREVPMVGVRLLCRTGYFRQKLDSNGRQSEIPEKWNPAKELDPPSAALCINLENRLVCIRAWSYVVRGISGHNYQLTSSTWISRKTTPTLEA